MPSHRCRHTASSSAPPLRLSKMQGAPPAPRFSALFRNYRGVAHFRSAVSFRGSNVKPNDPHAGHGGCGGGPQSGTASHLRAKDFQMILCEGTAGNSLHIGKAHSHKSARKNCSRALSSRLSATLISYVTDLYGMASKPHRYAEMTTLPARAHTRAERRGKTPYSAALSAAAVSAAAAC